ncbi:MAG: MATE family efflux transporter, partial [Geminicoccaceae bacterium]
MSTIPAATATPAFAASTGLARELRAMFALALPLVLTQLLQVLVNTTEVVMLGWLDARALAAASLAAALLHTAMMFGVGIASATAPLVAQAKGARQARKIRRV